MKVVPIKRQATHRPEDAASDEDVLEGLANLADWLEIAPFGLLGSGFPGGKAKPMSEATLAQKIQALLEGDSAEWPPLYRRPTLKHIVRALEEWEESEGGPIDLVGLVSLLEWQNLMAPLEVIKRLLEKGLREDGPLALTPDHRYVLKPRGHHAAGNLL